MDLGVIIRTINGIIALGEIWPYLGSDCLELVLRIITSKFSDLKFLIKLTTR